MTQAWQICARKVRVFLLEELFGAKIGSRILTFHKCVAGRGRASSGSISITGTLEPQNNLVFKYIQPKLFAHLWAGAVEE